MPSPRISVFRSPAAAALLAAAVAWLAPAAADPPKVASLTGQLLIAAPTIGDPRFATPPLRQENSAELIAIIDLIVASKTLAEWERLFRENDVVWSLVPSAAQVAADPQMEANGVFAQIPGGPKTIQSPLNVEGEEKRQPSRAPNMGEHTAEVLRSIGYDDAAIETLVKRGACGAG